MARTFVWTPAKEQAAVWEHEGRLSQAKIAAQLGTTRRTIEGWVRRPAFRQRVDELHATWMREWEAEKAAERRQRQAEAEREAAIAQAETDAHLAGWQARLERILARSRGADPASVR